MKKTLFLFVVAISLFGLFFFDNVSTKKKRNVEKVVKEENKTKKEELRAVFVSYMELNNHIQDKDIFTAKNNIDKIIKNIKDNNLNTIILQVRSHDDAIYDSENFRISPSIILNDSAHFDVLDYFINKSKDNNINLYIWINPYRITRLNENIEVDSFANKYKDTDMIKNIDSIYYYNPAYEEVTNHIIDGIKELIHKYEIKAILFDDYFYPSNDISEKEYKDYLNKNDYITLENYHLMVINQFIEKVYKAIKEEDKNILFGISPDGNIDNNYNKNYADVLNWCSSDKYIDFIMPQIYYGFLNSNRPFEETIKKWNEIITNKNIKLYYALAFYKVGIKDLYAKDGINEWIENDDIIKNQILMSRNIEKYEGFALFRYDNIFNEKYFTINSQKEIENLKSTLK